MISHNHTKSNHQVVDIEGVIFKKMMKPYTGKITIFWENNKIKEEGIYREGVKSGFGNIGMSLEIYFQRDF